MDQEQAMEVENKDLRRLVRISVSPEIMLTMMKRDLLFHVVKGLPKTARFRGIVLDPGRNCIGIFASDESFAEVPDGCAPADFDVDWVRVEAVEDSPA